MKTKNFSSLLTSQLALITLTAIATGITVMDAKSSDDWTSSKKVKMDKLNSSLSSLTAIGNTPKIANLDELVKSWKVKGEGDLYQVPKDVILAHILNSKFLSTNEILNFGATCRSHYSLIQIVPVVKLEKLRFHAMKEAMENAKNIKNKGGLPVIISTLKYYKEIFNTYLQNYKEKEKKKILDMGESTDKQQIALSKLQFRLLFLNFGYHHALCGALYEFEHGDYVGEKGYDMAVETEQCIAYWASEAATGYEEHLTTDVILIAALNEAQSIAINTVKDVVFNVVKNFLGSEKGRSFTNNNQDMDLVGYYAWQIGQIEANHVIVGQLATFIENLDKRLQVIFEDKKDLPPFHNKETFWSYLLNNESYQFDLNNLRKQNATHLIEPTMEIIASVFDN